MRPYLFVWLAALFLSCGTSRIPEDGTVAIIPDQQEAIVFLSFKMEKDPVAHENKISLIGKTKASGKVKKGSDTNADTPNFLTVELFQNGTLAKTFTISHPLYKHVEYLGDDNKYTFKDAEVDAEEFFIRIQTKGNQNEIRIFENGKSCPKKELLTLNL
ncbi:MAG TPA: hypothetical protein VK528_10540 [Flavobacterium sp.]|nr:hypothetical protein [Flavobacterium sp.]